MVQRAERTAAERDDSEPRNHTLGREHLIGVMGHFCTDTSNCALPRIEGKSRGLGSLKDTIRLLIGTMVLSCNYVQVYKLG